jgi:secondary thiamine-phosphate synthase enzyme
MITSSTLADTPRAVFFVRHMEIVVDTVRATEFVDLTAMIAATVQSLGFLEGVVVVHTRHTTTGIVVNEREPLLFEDLEEMFERLAPQGAAYAHDDVERRTVNLGPGERVNGHAHCRAILLHGSESIPVADGQLVLGRWQRVMFVELDGGQRRRVGLTLMGHARHS